MVGDVDVQSPDLSKSRCSQLATIGLVVILGSLILSCTDKTPTSARSPSSFEDLVGASFSVRVPERAPLSAEATFRTTQPVSVSVDVLDDPSVSHTFEDSAEEHRIPILGLRADVENRVEIRLITAGGEEFADTLAIQTAPLPDLFPTVDVAVFQPDLAEPGWTLASLSIGDGGRFLSYPFMIDGEGEIRWFLDLSHFGRIVYMVERFANGNLLFGHGSSVYEYDRLGQEIDRWDIPGFLFHHDVIEKPDGNLIVAVSSAEGETVEDHVIEIDRETGAVVRVWDFREILDVERTAYIDNPRDWFHMNAVWYDEDDDALIVSGRNQSAVVKVTMEGDLVWILAAHRGWGPEVSPFLLTALDSDGVPLPADVQEGSATAPDFDWSWGQHAPLLLPNGNLFLFDNGLMRNFTSGPAGASYSRGVEYEIDEEGMTIRQIWEYGRERGNPYYASIISDVDHLPETGNRLVVPGVTFEGTAFVTEVTVPEKEVVFEAAFDFLNDLGSEVTWGEFDLIYRAERVPLYP